MANVDYIIEGLQSLTDTDSLLRSVAFRMLADTRDRIHNEGLRATGSPIGTYSPEYMKLRTDSYKSKVYTRGEKKGLKRPQYKLLPDTNIIFFLTGAMQNNYKVIAISDTEYGLGFDIVDEGNKSVWLADRFGSDIWQLSDSELSTMESIIQQFVNDAFA